MTNHNPDQELISRIVAGDPEAIEEFAARFRPLLITFAKKRSIPWPDFEDVAHEALQAALDQIKRKVFRCDSRISTWLHPILEGKASDYFRSQFRITSRLADSILPDGLPSPRTDQELSLIVQDVLDKMPELHRLVLEQRFIERRHSKDIAIELGQTEDTVNSKVFEAKEIFAKLFGRERKRREQTTNKDKDRIDE